MKQQIYPIKNNWNSGLRLVDDNLAPHKEFIGMHPLVNTSVYYTVLVIKYISLRINLKIENVRGQCYNRASATQQPKLQLD